MLKGIVVIALIVFGGLLLAVALLGSMGVWDEFLSISLVPLRESWQWPTGLAVGGAACWFCAGIFIRT